jgi:hypothetical protein
MKVLYAKLGHRGKLAYRTGITETTTTHETKAGASRKIVG